MMDKNPTMDGLGSSLPSTPPWLFKNKHAEFQSFSSTKPHDVTRTTEVMEDLYKKSTMGEGKRAETLFYYIVQGGNVRWARLVLEELRQPKHTKLRQWALGQTNNPECSRHRVYRGFKRTRYQHMATFGLGLLLTLLYIVLTPVFYICHAVMSAIWIRLFAKTKDNPSLPLALVCRSKSQEMMKLFLEEGLDIRETDLSGNNVMHYLATLSAKDVQGAIKMWNNLLVVNGHSHFSMLCSAANNGGLSPLELCGRVGSVLFLSHMMDSSGISKKVRLQVSENQGYVDDTEETTSIPEPSPFDSDMHTDPTEVKLAWYDLTKYESGDGVCNQSLLLRMLSQRDLYTEAGEELQPLLDNSTLSSWIHKKTSSTGLIILRLIGHSFVATFTAMFLYGVSETGGDTNLFPLQTAIWTKTIEAAQNNATFPIWDSNFTMYNFFGFCYSPEAYYGSINTYSWCTVQGVQQVQETCQGRVSDYDLLFNAGVIKDDTVYDALGISQVVMLSMGSMYFFFDFVLRIVFLWRNLWGNSFNPSITASLNRVICHKVPGSYLSKQITLLACSLDVSQNLFNSLFYQPYMQRTFSVFDETWTVSEYFGLFREEYGLLFMYTSIISLMLRLVDLVYSLRLLPSIGHFIVVTFKMTETLIQFLVVYLLILVAFGTMFHFLLRDPACPIFRYTEYDDIQKASYQAFLLALGMAEFPADHTPLAEATYIIYLLLSAIVLMNLVIAVMTLVVEEISDKDHKPCCLLMHHLNDALLAEAGWQVFTLPCLRFLHRWSLGRAGFVLVEQEKDSPSCSCCGGRHGNKEYCVYLEKVHIPK